MYKKNATYEDLMLSVKSYIQNEESIALIQKAYELAKSKHEGQFRRSGEPYLNHPINVAYILSTLNSNPATICGGLLHDVCEDCDVSVDEMKELFGEEIARLVDGCTKIGAIKFKDEKEYFAENHRKIFIAMAKDIRVIMIKLADRLHNMRTLDFMPIEKQKKISKETLDVYAPIAHRLGISEIKNELEDLAFFYLDKEKYYEIARLVENRKSERDAFINEMIKKIEDILHAHNIPYRIFGRSKHLYSIYKKMTKKNKRFEEIFDLLAIRIITSTDLNCYEILGYIHAMFMPIPGRFKDYIAMPKPNMYQSLHTTILEEGSIFEIQIRTEDMDAIAEKGVAAHWRYKEGIKFNAEESQKEIEAKLQWFKELVAISDVDDNQDAQQYMDSLQKDIFEANVYVLSPRGRVIELPNGSTPLDFAYRIHTEVGHNTIGALVNGVLVPLNTVLKTGDVVEMRTQKHGRGPSEDWLKIVKTSHAKSKIRAYFTNKQRENRAEVIKNGEELIKEELRKRQIHEKDFLDSKKMEHYLSDFAVNTYEDLLFAVGSRSLNPTTLVDKISNKKVIQDNALLDYINKSKTKTISQTGIIVPGIEGMKIVLAGCCNPIPGDEIVGFITKGQGVKVHRCECPNIKNETKRIINVEWDEEFSTTRKYEVDIIVYATDRSFLLSDIITMIAQCKANLVNIHGSVAPDKITAIFKIRMSIENNEHYRLVVSNLRKVNSVTSVERTIH